jgi:5-methylcytosine-specific restriction protein A
MPPNAEDFERQLFELIRNAREQRQQFIDVVSGELHRQVGGYPANDGNHRMPVCCEVMKNIMQDGDEILYSPDSGQGATLRIRYHLSP